jgi:two-component system cell cycle response regulator
MPARILIIEDNPANLELVRYLLAAHGYPTLTAMNGEEGLHLFGSERPDVVLCDLQLPIRDGYEVLAEIRKDPARGDTIVIAVTAFSMSGDRAKATSAGFDGYIPKPIDPTTFVQQVEGLLRPDLRALQPPSGS